MKSLIIAAITALAFSAHAEAPLTKAMLQVNQQLFQAPMAVGGWVAGDTCAYNLSIGSFIQGTMNMTVKSFDSKTLVIDQDMSVMGQSESCEESLDAKTGKVISAVCNGQQQNTNDGDIKVDSIKDEKVTVPAGTFDSEHITAHTVSNNQQTEIWVNPKLIPVAGMAKTLAQTQLGQMDVELTSFKKN